MNLNTPVRMIVYLSAALIAGYLLVREYSYVHPYNTGYSLLGPKWTYSSTMTITWWFILLCSLVMATPLFRKQKIGLVGLFLLIVVVIRPIVQIRFPEESAIEFFKDRQTAFRQLITDYQHNKDGTITNARIKELGFEKLIIDRNTYYFIIVDEEWPYGICYTSSGELPEENFERHLKYNRLNGNWYEFDY